MAQYAGLYVNSFLNGSLKNWDDWLALSDHQFGRIDLAQGGLLIHSLFCVRNYKETIQQQLFTHAHHHHFDYYVLT